MRLYQTKKLLYSEGNYQQIKKSPTGWEKISVNYIQQRVKTQRVQTLKKKSEDLDIFPKKADRWSKGIWKNAQHQ